MISSTLSSYISNIQQIYSTLSGMGAVIPSNKNISNIYTTLDTLHLDTGNNFKNLVEGNVSGNYIGNASYISTRYAFRDVPVTSITFPECQTISTRVFGYCSTLQSVNFSVCREIGTYAFESCTNLSIVNLQNNSVVPTLSGSNAFLSTPIANSTYLGYYGSIYVPASLYSNYIGATNWAYFATRITSSVI